MAFIHPDRARNLGNARAPDERSFPVNGRAEPSLSVQERNRKRKWNTSGDEHQLIGGGEATAPNRHDTRALRSNALDADRSKRPRVKAPDPPRQDNPRRRNQGIQAERNVEKLERAHQLAPNYPNLRDIEAWRELGKSTKRRRHAEHAFVYRRLRLDQRPIAVGYKEWNKRVQQEMVELDLQDAHTGPLVDRASGDGVKDEATKEVAQEAMGKSEDEQARKEMEVMIADDGLDIDIYGDEETRRKYEP